MSTATIATILLLGVFLVLVFLRVPVVYAIGVASLLDFFYLGINPMQMALKWGTPEKVRFIDSLTGVPLELGASGEMNFASGRLPEAVGKAGGHRKGDFLGAMAA